MSATREDLLCVISDLTDQVREARAERDSARAECERLRGEVAALQGDRCDVCDRDGLIYVTAGMDPSGVKLEEAASCPALRERDRGRVRATRRGATVNTTPTVCQCTHEAGDSACPRHPTCDECGCTAERHAVDDEELRECRDCGCEQYVDAWKSILDARDLAAAALRAEQHAIAWPPTHPGPSSEPARAPTPQDDGGGEMPAARGRREGAP